MIKILSCFFQNVFTSSTHFKMLKKEKIYFATKDFYFDRLNITVDHLELKLFV